MKNKTGENTGIVLGLGCAAAVITFGAIGVVSSYQYLVAEPYKAGYATGRQEGEAESDSNCIVALIDDTAAKQVPHVKLWKWSELPSEDQNSTLSKLRANITFGDPIHEQSTVHTFARKYNK